MNREPEKVLDRDNNKPALRKNLIPALRAKYGDKHEVWRKLLSIVTHFAGPTLQHKYLAGLMLGDTRTIRLPAIAQTARDLIYQIPEIADNLAL